MLGKATWHRKRMESLHDMMKGRDYEQLKDIRWRRDSENACQKPAGNSKRLTNKMQIKARKSTV